MKNPYNINTQENKFNSWSLGYECNGSIESNPFGEDLEPELFRIFEQGYKAKNRAPKASAPEPQAVSTLVSNGDPVAQKGPLNVSPEVDLSHIPTDQLFKEASKRISEGEALLLRVKKLLG
jgi:hypothetical protein